MTTEQQQQQHDEAKRSPPSRFEILSTKSPLPCFDPTEATLKDKVTGKIYQWNSRAHRKLRHPYSKDDEKRTGCPKIWVFEPHIVTWHLNQCNQMANTFWVIGAIFATWPLQDNDKSAKIVYASNLIACLFMIASCYFAYVEAINHTHSDIVFTSHKADNSKKQRTFLRSNMVYGLFRSPIRYNNHGLDSSRHRARILEMGFPIVESTDTEKLISLDIMNEAIADEEETAVSDSIHSLIGDEFNIRSQEYVCRTTLQSITKIQTKQSSTKSSYIWWTWTPALNHVGVLCALLGLISSLVYLIPMVVSYPMDQNGATVGATVFLVDVLQVIPYIACVITGHIYIAEAAGSFWRPKLDSIGYYIALFNTIGAYVFLLCGALAIPDAVGASCCPNIARWGSAFACFWGACAYWIGGFLQFIEFSNPDQ